MQKDSTVGIAFRLYPKWWRDRYLDEAQAVTDELAVSGRSRWRIAMNLVFGAMRARLDAAGMPLQYDLWAARTRATIVLATAPALVVMPLMLTIRQVPANPTGAYAGSVHLASLIYLALIVAFFGLASTMMSGYFSLSGGILERNGNGRLLRSLARAPLYLTLAALTFFIASLVVGPHHYDLKGKVGGPIDGHPFVALLLQDLAATTIVVCGITSAVLISAVIRYGDISVSRLKSGKGFAITIAGWLWVMTAAAFALATVYSTRVTVSGHIAATSTILGNSLFLFAGVLLVLAAVSTTGSALAIRSSRITTHLALGPCKNVKR